MSQKQSFGIMDDCYFVPRSQILDWINNLLHLNLNKIEQLGSGAVYCQILDVIHPGKVPLTKVNWKARNDYQFIGNMKLLQSGFEKAGIKRYVEVEKLARAKYQDNLEFIQWFKRYYDVNCGQRGNSYPAEEKRGSVPVDFSFAEKLVVPKSYNASGQVIPKNEKTEHVAKKQSNPNIVSAVAAYRTENKDKERKKENIVHSSNKKSEAPNKDKDQKQKIKDLQSKLDMIKQIAESGESAQEKMKLIEEVLSINPTTTHHEEAMEQSPQKIQQSPQKIDEQEIL